MLPSNTDYNNNMVIPLFVCMYQYTYESLLIAMYCICVFPPIMLCFLLLNSKQLEHCKKKLKKDAIYNTFMNINTMLTMY